MGSRRTGNGVEKVYTAAEAWIDRALRTDDALFTPGKPIWTSENLGELRECFGFYAKLERQLAGSPAKWMGEVLKWFIRATTETIMYGWSEPVPGTVPGLVPDNTS